MAVAILLRMEGNFPLYCWSQTEVCQAGHQLAPTMAPDLLVSAHLEVIEACLGSRYTPTIFLFVTRL